MSAKQRFGIANAGWTLGNDCPYRCKQCYSAMVRTRGRNLHPNEFSRIISQIVKCEIGVVNLGGNEPLFTNGLDPRQSLLPRILCELKDCDITVGLTTAGITANYLAENYPGVFRKINDIDVSLDSPFAEEHDVNRGAPLFRQGLDALAACRKAKIPHTIVMCGMNWNLTERHLDGLIDLSKKTESYFRINFLRPTQEEHLAVMPTAEQFQKTIAYLFSRCRSIENGEPVAQALMAQTPSSCPCGITSLRIHSITPEGRVPVSPCVYLHDFRTGDLLTENLEDVLASRMFEEFRQRHLEPKRIEGCGGCRHIDQCKGGCASRAHLAISPATIWRRDPYCPGPDLIPPSSSSEVNVYSNENLVHRGYLCTLIFSPN